MIQFSKQELEKLLVQAHADMEFAVDPDKTDFNGNQYVTHLVRLSMAASMLVIADNLTAMRFSSNSDVTRIADGMNDVFNVLEGIRRSMP